MFAGNIIAGGSEIQVPMIDRNASKPTNMFAANIITGKSKITVSDTQESDLL